jgi:CheY-like chemotaxis protein
VQPDIKVIHLTASKDRELRRRMLAAGAVAVFDKPVPLGDFVDAVQRGLGLARTILQTEDDASITPAVLSLTDRIAGLQGDLGVDALFVISSRGRVAARAGSLNDSSMEVSLISSAAATIAAGMKVAQANHGSGGSHFSIFPAGDQDIILVPLGPSHALLAAGEGLAAASSLAATLRALERAGGELASSLESGSAEPAAVNRSSASRTPGQVNAELDDLLTDPSRANLSPEDLDAYWNEGAARHGDGSPSEGGISYDEARKRGLTPGQES